MIVLFTITLFSSLINSLTHFLFVFVYIWARWAGWDSLLKAEKISLAPKSKNPPKIISKKHSENW